MNIKKAKFYYALFSESGFDEKTEAEALENLVLYDLEALMADETLSEDAQAQVDQAVLTLQDAIDALEPVNPDDPGQAGSTPTPGGSGGGNSGNGQNTQNGNKPSGGSGTGGSQQKPPDGK